MGSDVSPMAIQMQMRVSIRPIAKLQNLALSAGIDPLSVDLSGRGSNFDSERFHGYIYTQTRHLLLLLVRDNILIFEQK
jgi:hypothetical protein